MYVKKKSETRFKVAGNLKRILCIEQAFAGNVLKNVEN